jgi:hypothetical protein
MGRLARRDSQTVMAPLDVVEGQSGHFASPEPIGNEQEQHRVIPPGQDSPAINAVQQFPHVLNRNRSGQMREPIARGGLHDRAKITNGQMFPVQIAQKHAEHRAPSSHRGAAKT